MAGTSEKIEKSKGSASQAKKRLKVLTEILSKGLLSTQDELVEELSRQNFEVTQSTISRDLRRIGAVKGFDVNGDTVYRLNATFNSSAMMTTGFEDQVLDITNNGHMIVIHTQPGSASLIARHVDARRAEGFLGTIAGDDTVFIAPRSMAEIDRLTQLLVADFA